MKKLFVAALLSIASMGLVACGGEEAPATPAAPRQGYFLTGPACLKVNGKTAEESGGAAWGYGGDAFELKEITLAKAKEISPEVGGKLEADNRVVKKIYSLSGVEMGVGDAGYNKKLVMDGEIYETNASFTAKIIHATYSSELGVMATDAWTPDPGDSAKPAHVENLMNYFCPSWQKEKDDYGFSWADDSVVSGGAGIYTVIFVEYNDVATKNTYNYGTAFVKTEAKEGYDYKKVEPEPEFDPTEHEYGVIGSFEGSGWTTDLPMTKKEDAWGGIYDFKAGDEFKVRVLGDWDHSWGSESVINKDAMKDNFNFDEGNIKVTVDGSYGVAIEFVEGVAQITLGIPNEE